VFDAFFATYAPRVEDLIRLATGGTGILGAGYLHPDLVNRLTQEAGDTAQRVLDLCIRAFEYLPPIDVTFGDFLRALVTADTELHPDDPYDLRANLVDAFFARGIHPEGVFSLNEESLLWEQPHISIVGDPLDLGVLDNLAAYEAQRWGVSTSAKERRPVSTKDRRPASEIASVLHSYATRHAPALGLEPGGGDRPIQVRGFHTMFRVGDDGQLLTEAAVQFVQTPSDAPNLGGLTPRAGATVVFSGDGTPRYLISKPLRFLANGGLDLDDPRVRSMRSFVEECDERDPYYAWAGQAYDPRNRMSRRFNFAFVHQGIETRKRERFNGQ
jgi:hypothetical protein